MHIYVVYKPYSKEVSILPETEVRGSLQKIYLELKARGISNCKLPMTEAKGCMICDIHHLIMVLIIYTMVCRWIMQVVSVIAFLD